ncbi:hypothetical protein [Macrococcus animalis]|uniref:hypothetical protein n=1 Tax=Macrococcus animalis TaxID=3395467 RepID=UPI0039BE44FA
MLSLFVMDVSGSTKFNNTDAISKQLIQFTKEIDHWTQNVSFKYINFRMGDELFFVSDNLSATLFTSYYIKLLWPFNNQPVKFGIAVSDEAIPKGNLEHWNAPIIKQARHNLAQIKQGDMSDFYLTIDHHNVDIFNNILYPYLTEIVHNHSDMQRKVILLSYVYEQQKEIAKVLDKGVSTISEHLKKGHKKQLLLIEAALADLANLVDEDNKHRERNIPLTPFIYDTFKEYAL